MEGTIKIEAIPDMGVSLEMNIRHVSIFDMMGVFDALAQGFKMDKDTRKMFGVIFAMGGIDAMPGVTKVAAEVDKDMLDLLKKMQGDKNNETDAH